MFEPRERTERTEKEICILRGIVRGIYTTTITETTYLAVCDSI
jgi:hypothetical protein